MSREQKGGKIGRHWKLSEETKRRQILAKKGISPRGKGYKLTEETKRRIGLANSIALKGKSMLPHVKEILRKANTGVNNYRWKGGLPHCKDCEKKLSAYTCIFCRNCAKKGNRSERWKGGITPANMQIRRSHAYKKWARAVKERDDYRCFDCGIRGGYLEADHIYSFAKYPRLRMLLENGITRCKKCHLQITQLRKKRL